MSRILFLETSPRFSPSPGGGRSNIFAIARPILSYFSRASRVGHFRSLGARMSLRTSGTNFSPGPGGGLAGVLLIAAVVGGFWALSYILPAIPVVANAVWEFVAPVVLGTAFSLKIIYWSTLLTQFPIEFPAYWAAISGILAGAVIAWIRMAFRSKEKYEPVVSAIFSQEPLSHGGWEFVWRLLADVVAGYFIMVLFATLRFVPTIDDNSTVAIYQIGVSILGAGGSGGFGGPDTIAFLVFVLVAILFAAAIMAAVLGGTIGSGLGLGLWTTHMIHGGAQGTTVHLLLAQRRSPGPKKHLLGYIVLGGVSGAFEAFIVGAICGCIIDFGYI
jgi:hypothetical protein